MSPTKASKQSLRANKPRGIRGNRKGQHSLKFYRALRRPLTQETNWSLITSLPDKGFALDIPGGTRAPSRVFQRARSARSTTSGPNENKILVSMQITLVKRPGPGSRRVATVIFVDFSLVFQGQAGCIIRRATSRERRLN